MVNKYKAKFADDNVMMMMMKLLISVCAEKLEDYSLVYRIKQITFVLDLVAIRMGSPYILV